MVKKLPRKMRAIPVQKFENELFPRQEGKGWRMPGWLCIGLCILVLGTIGVALYSPIFRITTVTVGGDHRVQADVFQRALAQTLNERRFGVLPSKNFLVLSRAQTAQHLKERLAAVVALEEVTVEKEFPRTLHILLQRRQPVAVYTTLGESYLIDAAAVIVERAPEPAEGGTVPTLTLHDQNDLPVAMGETAVAPTMTEKLPMIDERLRSIGVIPLSFETGKVRCPAPIVQAPPEEGGEATNGNTNMANASVPLQIIKTNANSTLGTANEPAVGECILKERLKTQATLEVLAEAGWRIRLDTREDVETQIEKLQRFLTENTKERVVREYVDLRFPDYVYFR